MSLRPFVYYDSEKPVDFLDFLTSSAKKYPWVCLVYPKETEMHGGAILD